ncbi:flavin reductase family protein [Anaerovorax odorimutans]|nr:flavin reductase family protein [Anaerovorax odorimutans]
MKKHYKHKDILFPVPAALIVTGDIEHANIVTVAWIGIMGSDPEVIGISLKHDRYSLNSIEKYGEFTVNIPSSSLFRQVDYCGLTSGKVVDKFSETGFSKGKSIVVNTPIIEECPLNLECKVIKAIDIGQWKIFVGEIVETQLDADCIDINEKVDINKIDPLVYIPTIREYWSIGTILGKAFDAGRCIKGNHARKLK